MAMLMQRLTKLNALCCIPQSLYQTIRDIHEQLLSTVLHSRQEAEHLNLDHENDEAKDHAHHRAEGEERCGDEDPEHAQAYNEVEVVFAA